MGHFMKIHNDLVIEYACIWFYFFKKVLMLVWWYPCYNNGDALLGQTLLMKVKLINIFTQGLLSVKVLLMLIVDHAVSKFFLFLLGSSS